MRKIAELTNPSSCMNRAKPNEMVFVLLGRDVAAPATIRRWCEERIALGKNKVDDEQIIAALHDADVMEREQKNVLTYQETKNAGV